MKKCIRTVLMTALIAASLIFGTAIASAGLLSVNLSPAQNTLNTEQHTINQQLEKLICAPSNLTATSIVPGKVTLTWKDNSNNETGFMIERKFEGGTFFVATFAAANATSCEESQLSNNPVYPGEKYYYRIKAINDSGVSGYSNEAFVSVPALPMLKAEIMVSVGNHPVKLTWTDYSDDETKFVVQRQKEGYGFEFVKELPPDTTEYRDTATLQKDVKYTYRIQVFNSSGSAYSNYDSVVYPSGNPSPPQYFAAIAQGPTSIRLSWTDTSDNEEGFWIGRKKTGSGSGYPPSTNPDFDLGPNVTEVLDTGLEPDTEYSYIIAAHNALYSSFIAETKATTGPRAPILTANAVSSGEIELTWVDQSSNLDTYQIERRIEGGSYAKLVTLTHPAALAYSDKAVSPGTKYYYRIKAWRVWYPSDFSQETSATTPQQSYQQGQFSVVPQANSNIKEETGQISNIIPVNTRQSPQSDSGASITGKSAENKINKFEHWPDRLPGR